MPERPHGYERRRERETKLAVPPGFRVPTLDGTVPDAAPVERGEQHLTADYYDTADLCLSRWGASVRFRDDEGWTVKVPVAIEGGVLVRDEHHFAGTVAAMPSGATDLVQGLVRGAPLALVARLVTHRQRVDLVDGDGHAVVSVVDDDVTVQRHGRTVGRFREIEVELAPSTADGLDVPVVAALRDAGAVTSDPTPKVVRALGAAAVAPPDVVVPALPRDPTVGAVARRAIAASVLRLVTHDPGVRLGADIEAVHQARVATRRLRSDLRTFRRFLDPDWDTSLRAELRWLADELGPVRDAEVLLDRMRGRIASLPEADRGPTTVLLDRLAARHAAARAELLTAIRSERYVALLDRLVDAAHHPAFGEAAAAPARDALARVVRTRWKRLRDAVTALDPVPADEDLHQVRILAKRARYAAEAAAPALGAPARRLGRACARIHDVLGDHQDAVLARAWVVEQAAGLTHDGAFAAGMIAGIETAAAERARAAFPAAWRAARRARLR